MGLRFMTGDKVRDGQEPLIKPAVDHLVGLGIPLDVIRSVTVTATVGEPVSIKVDMFVRDKEVPKP